MLPTYVDPPPLQSWFILPITVVLHVIYLCSLSSPLKVAFILHTIAVTYAIYLCSPSSLSRSVVPHPCQGRLIRTQ